MYGWVTTVTTVTTVNKTVNRTVKSCPHPKVRKAEPRPVRSDSDAPAASTCNRATCNVQRARACRIHTHYRVESATPEHWSPHCPAYGCLRALSIPTLAYQSVRGFGQRHRHRIPTPRLPAPRLRIRTLQQRSKSWLSDVLGGGTAPPLDRMSTPETKPGFLSVGINALSPWGSRSATPKPPGTPKTPKRADEDRDKDRDKAAADGAGAQRGGDHTVNRRPRLSLKRYPQDCPPLVVRWFHAVDVSSSFYSQMQLVPHTTISSPSVNPSHPTPLSPTSPCPGPRNGYPFLMKTRVPLKTPTSRRLPKLRLPRNAAACSVPMRQNRPA